MPVRRKVIKASSNKKYTDATFVHNYLKALIDAGVPESDIVEYFYDYLSLETFMEVLEKIADITGCTDEVEDLVADYTVTGSSSCTATKVNGSTQLSKGERAAEEIQRFINGYGFQQFDVYARDDNWLAIHVEDEDESEVISLLNRLHAYGLDADTDTYDHYIEIFIGDDDRF